LTGVVIFAARSRHLELTRDRDQVRWLLWGFAIGAAPYVFLRTLPQLMGLPTLMPPHVDRVIELAIPLSFVMAVVRHQFLEIDVIIRRSLLYGLLAATLLAVYLVAGVVFGRWLGLPQGMDPWIPPVILGLGAGISFLPLRRSLGGWIDRTFFKLAHDHDRTLDNLDHDLSGVADPDSVGVRVQARIATALKPEHLTVVIKQGPESTVVGDLDSATATWALTAFPDTRIFLAAAPRSTSRPELERNDFPLDLLEEGVILYQPLFQGEKILGAILLGPRATGRRYVAQDLAFLASCARVADRHLERIALLQTVAEESLARKRLAELDRLKSEFLAQVAHDLRTPVAGITWSARNLLEGLVGELTPDQADYMGSIATSGAHLNRLVDNLLEISRLEDARQSLVIADFQAAEVWSEAMTTVRPLAEAKDVTLEMVRPDEGVPLVRGHRDKMIEVTVNLLDNAVKYTAPGTVVTVTVESPKADTLTVALRDRGPGLCGQRPKDLLGRFAQGEPSPHSSRKGFGLGLHIAATYLDLMGGRLEAGDHPDGGAVFTCILPLAGSPAGVPQQGDEP
jgi:signal transduction histidine kinase